MNISGILWKRSQTLKNHHLIARLVSTNEKIEIPKRIPRGPTDILRALESTIQRDPTAAHYKYHDDPYLIPSNNLSKRSFAMAKEAGRKAAHWVRSENPELFNHRECEPPIDLFFPKMAYNENTDVTEDDLKNVIDRGEVSDAILISNLLKTKDIQVSDEIKQSLLELLCYNNSSDTLSDEFIEERWFKQSSSVKEKQRKTWKDGAVAEEIFISIDSPNAETYSALIQGMVKYNQAARAYQLFEEAQQKGLVPNVDTYNAIIRVANFLKEGFDLRWRFVINILQSIKQAGYKPNLGTLNAVLYTLSTMGTSQAVKGYTLKVLKEFKNLGIEPSLASWYHVLVIFCKERGPKSRILENILIEVENKNHHIRDLIDTHFFVTAMDVAKNHLNNLSLGERIHQLLLLGNNYNLIGDSYKESIYYRHYFSLLLTNTPFEEFMEKIYNNMVPYIYIPEPIIMREVIKQIELNGATEHIPRIWSDMIIFNHHNREDLINYLLTVMVENEPPKDSKLIENFGNIAWDIYNTIDGQNEERFNSVQFSGEMLGKLLTLVLRNNDFQNGCTIMEKLDSKHSSIVGVPSFESLSLFVDMCIKNKSPSKAINCIQYASDCGFPDTLALGAKLNEGLTLDENHLDKLSKCVNLKLS
ncbi:protein PTCD3 homolog, mitochondrial [Anthonomus grandis grandis]|uniref:protein PTCD3 homolog, mitochondrial n=1 Tax=Anthonomus grandis grandis TaxID=2921223 RepID=UPI002164F72B|nr:protein PTCD3 homolog, mitochondrial [Anthonomus grandis grandis]